jgi:hypothetical protein
VRNDAYTYGSIGSDQLAPPQFRLPELELQGVLITWNGRDDSSTLEFTMRRTFAIAIGSALILGLAAAYAQDQRPAPNQRTPTEQGMPMGQGMQGMMHNGMMGQMSRMMENCNKMMESHMQQRQQQQGR